MSSMQGVKDSLVNIQAIVDRDLRGSISDGDYLQLVSVIKILYDKNAITDADYEEDYSDGDLPVETRAHAVIDQERNTACLVIQNMWRKFKTRSSQDWIDKEGYNIFGKLFDEDERNWSLQYLECSWKDMYRKHYGLGWRDLIPGDKITLSYWDFVSLSRGNFGRY
jgi:hypothetical protein